MKLNRTRRIAAVAIAFATEAALDASLLTTPASADDNATLTVVGTSDVYDSNLVQTVLRPGFEKAYPQYTLNYVSKGTGAAIAYAKAGTASAMIVHAAALENQFVDEGYSLEPYGRAIFWGDYVLLGPANDPAGVLTGDSSTNIITAFQKVAAAGETGTANFVSRGGTPGTTVQEHAIWSQTTGVDTCAVSDTDGGGTSPSTTSGACGSPIAYPDWYHATGLTQAPNIEAGDVCNFPNEGCYVFTDRGTFNYLQSTGKASNLKLVTRADPNGDPALSNLLVNSFHAYAINPAKFDDNVQINTTAATRFLDWITSPAGQSAVGAFLGDVTHGDPPFIPSAAPELTVTARPAAKIVGNGAIAIKGTLRNVVPGTPMLNGVPVKLLARPSSTPTATPRVVATTRTNTKGAFTIAYRPKASQTYSVAVDDITKIENTVLDPVFGDILESTSAVAGTTTVKAKLTLTKHKLKKKAKKLKVAGKLRPGVTGTKAKVKLFAAHPGKKLKARGTQHLRNGATTYKTTFKLGKGTWKYQVRYVNKGVLVTGKTKTLKVRVR